MKYFIAACLVLPFLSLAGFPQMPKIPETKPVPAAPGKPALRPQASPLSPLICAEGKFSFTGNGQPLGSETYKITCNPGGGFSVTGHTELSVPGNPLVLSFPDRRHVEFSTPDKSLTLDTRFEADRKGAPVQFSAKGSHGNEPVSVSIAVAGRRAAIEIAGREKQTATADGSPLFVDNVFYLYQFILGRYDASRGGKQTIPVFPNGGMKIELAARDRAEASDFDRYQITNERNDLLVVWLDDKGQIALLSIPDKNLAAIRHGLEEQAAKLIAAFKASGHAASAEAPPEALIAAITKSDLAAVRAEIAGGANVNFTDDNGASLLLFAVVKSSPQVVGALINAKADVSARAPNGWTLLMVAADQGKAEVVQMLLRAGADPKAATSEGVTALAIAGRKNQTAISEMLRKAGAKE